MNIIIEKGIMVPMRDSVGLTTDIYRPDDGGEHPVLIIKSAYDKDDFWMIHELICSPLVAAQRGYVVLVQNDRGRYGSEGEWHLAGEGKDAYDTVEWAAAQPWSDGNVGLYGNCGLGYAPWFGAVEQPPHLKAIFSYVSNANFYEGWTYTTGGAFHLGFNLPWAGFLGIDTLSRAGLPPEELATAMAAIGEAMNLGNTPGQTAERLPLTLPLTELPGVSGLDYWRDWLSHPSYDEFWQESNAVAQIERIQVPVLHVTGWYDICSKGNMKVNEALMSRGDKRVQEQSRFVIGPWDHSAYLNHRETFAGERDFGVPTGERFLAPMIFQWFDQWLKGEEATFMPEGNTVRYFQMGENVWKEAPAWPPAHDAVEYRLHSTGRANSRFGNGTLSVDAPAIEPTDSYVYDPLDPVVSVGGMTMMMTSGVYDQAASEERQDILVYSTPRLASPVAIAGPVSVTLFASSSAPDTDFTAKLVDVEPDGYCANISEGIVRARYRNGTDREEFLTPGEVTRFDIELYDTAHTFKEGHCIRLEVSSSNFPVFDRNLNSTVTPALGTEQDAQKAVQQVFHDDEHSSYLVLPVVRS